MYIPDWRRLSSAATLRLRGRRDLPGDMSHLHFTLCYLDQNVELTPLAPRTGDQPVVAYLSLSSATSSMRRMGVSSRRTLMSSREFPFQISPQRLWLSEHDNQNRTFYIHQGSYLYGRDINTERSRWVSSSLGIQDTRIISLRTLASTTKIWN